MAAVDTLAGLNRTAIREIAARHGATHLRVFGSYAKGTNKKNSDLDLLIDLQPGRTLLDIVAIQQDIEDALGIRVDVVTERSLSPHIRDSILNDAISL